MSRILLLKSLNKSSISTLATFSHSQRGNFFQNEPKISNQYEEDPFLKEQLEIDIPKEYLKDIEPDLHQFGNKVATNIYELSLECERNVPRLESFDAWGNRIDKLIVCDAWKEMKNISATEGLIAIPYENKFSIYSRLYQIAKLYLFAPSSGLFSCPLAMTDGAARTIQSIVVQSFTKEAYERLTTRDPLKFWTSGQWMTERKGGSDVSAGTETEAYLQSDDNYKLYGFKWFSSATDSDMTVTLARVMDENSQPSKDLTMFFARIRRNDGKLNGIEIQRLKNKLGTRQLPTAELLLDGMDAFRMSEIGKGVSRMSSMLNVTRIHNSLNAIAFMRRSINFARDFATKRKAFGKLIIDHDLHCYTLGNMEVECRASLLTLFYVAKLLGKMECNQASKEELEMLRFITPLLKIYTAKQSIAVTSEGLEAIGGQGYIEDTGIPNLLRDSQVLSIWEGTTNILSLDALRSIKKSQGGSLKIFFKTIFKTCEQAKKYEPLKQKSDLLIDLSKKIIQFVEVNENELVTGAREFSFGLYRLFTASLILERCMKTNLKDTDLYLLEKWFNQDMIPIVTSSEKDFFSTKTSELNKKFFMNGHPSFKI
ncbi:acyl- dehydrogenase family member 11-like [Brachionus plicatilis]|uniref:Acyl-dehydrogenase family member 11-like n=1 Tax=Brachionus plicatilis TaxID=10195 RepID=A0A3M7PYC4_BRAPC|nr:acyl- dehydrogenase family member 11-like [Brachionus plicatilis]